MSGINAKAEDYKNNQKCCVMLKEYGEASDHFLPLANMIGAGKS
jgi:hypothetical protein